MVLGPEPPTYRADELLHVPALACWQSALQLTGEFDEMLAEQACVAGELHERLTVSEELPNEVPGHT